MSSTGTAHRRMLRGLIACGAVAAIGSYAGGHGYATETGWGWWAPVLPIGTDVFAAVVIAVWVTIPIPEIQRMARAYAWGAVAVSAAASATYGVLTADNWPVAVPGRIAPSVLLALACHLAARLAVLREVSASSVPPSTVQGGTKSSGSGGTGDRAGGPDAEEAADAGTTPQDASRSRRTVPPVVKASRRRYTDADIDDLAARAEVAGWTTQAQLLEELKPIGMATTRRIYNRMQDRGRERAGSNGHGGSTS